MSAYRIPITNPLNVIGLCLDDFASKGFLRKEWNGVISIN